MSFSSSKTNSSTPLSSTHPKITVTKANLENFSSDVSSLWPTITTLNTPPDAFTFLRDFVSVSRPCIIRNAITQPQRPQQRRERRQKISLTRQEQEQQGWQLGDDVNERTESVPLTLSLDDLVDLCRPSPDDSECDVDRHDGDGGGGDCEEMVLTVDVTPDGHGDCVRMVIVDENNDNEGENLGRDGVARKKMFVRPEERKMTLSQFRDSLRSSSINVDRSNTTGVTVYNNCPTSDKDDGDGFELNTFRASSSTLQKGCDDDDIRLSNNQEGRNTDEVFYYSRQNDCLRTGEFHPIFQPTLFPVTFPFAEEAFNTGPPDAVNLWIGNERSVSSMHKDHYENLFYVLSGEKVFTVCPPGDAFFLRECAFDGGEFRKVRGGDGDDDGDGGNGGWVVDCDSRYRDVCNGTDNAPQSNRVRWIEPDIERILPPIPSSSYEGSRSTHHHGNRSVTEVRSAYLQSHPSLTYAHPMRIHVREGEMLYLPALWYHRVTQTCETVAVNYWYDMRFDSPHWCYFNLLQHIGNE